MTDQRTAVIGLGSHHGDDSLGWSVIDDLIQSDVRDAILLKAKVPHDILDVENGVDTIHVVDTGLVDRWMEPLCLHVLRKPVLNCIESHRNETEQSSSNRRLILVAAAQGDGGRPSSCIAEPKTSSSSEHGTLDSNSKEVSAVPFPVLRSNSTHQTDLWTTLELADALGRLPSRVTIWVIPANSFAPGAPASEQASRAAHACAERILRLVE